MSLSSEVLDKIEEKKLKPIPKWIFFLKDFLMLAMALFSAILGSFGFAVVGFTIWQRDWFVYKETALPFFNTLFMDLPYLWLILIAATIVVAYLNLHHFRNSYRYPAYLIVLGSFILTLSAGAIFFKFGFGGKLDELIDHEIPIYTSSLDSSKNIWSQPQQGLLGGKIIERGENIISLQDFHNKIWQIDLTQNMPPQEREQLIGKEVKIIGHAKNGCFCFEAKKIYPWQLKEQSL